MLEDFIFAFTNFRRNKVRTLLSLLGIIIGVAAVIIIMSVGSSSSKKIVDQFFGSSGLDMVSIGSGFFRRNKSSVGINFNEEFRENLFDEIAGIKKVWYRNSTGGNISYGETSASSNLNAVEYGLLENYNFALEYGKFFDVTDDVMGCQKIILGSEIASTLFPNADGYGKNVIVVCDKVPFSFEVIGVLKDQSSGMENTSTGCYITRGFFLKKIKPNATADQVVVQAVSKETASDLVTPITEYCNKLSGSEGSVYVSSMQTYLTKMQESTRTMFILLSAIAAISLLVGGIGIMNIMIVTVTERRQEIGIRKALGAPPLLICRQFLVESSAITLLGGGAGIVMGVLLSLGIEYVVSLTYLVSSVSCVISFCFSVVVGIIFGISPAIKASKLNPVDALAL